MASKKSAAKLPQKKRDIIKPTSTSADASTAAAGGEGGGEKKSRVAKRRRFFYEESGERTKLLNVIFDEQKGGFRVHTLAENLTTGKKVKTVRGFDLDSDTAEELYESVCAESLDAGWLSKRVPETGETPSPADV